jgi:PPOX class probable F420-dependent enzyme
MKSRLENAVLVRLQGARVARLATVDPARRPHVVPVCFACSAHAIYTAVDRKPKRVAPEKLARVKHILENPEVALVVDRYLEDWSRLWFVLVRGNATLLRRTDGDEHTRALNMLRRKYRQYQRGFLSDDALVIRIIPWHITAWGRIQ